MTILKVATTVVWELRKVAVAQLVVKAVQDLHKVVVGIVARMVVKKAVPVVAMIRLSLLLVLIAVLLVAMAVKTVVMIVVKILPSLPVARAVAIVAIRLAHKLARQLVVVHVSQPVWDSARVLVCLDAKPDAGVGAGVTIDTNFE